MILKAKIMTPQNHLICLLPGETDERLSQHLKTLISSRFEYLLSEMKPGLLVASSIVEDGHVIYFQSHPYDLASVTQFIETYRKELEIAAIREPETYQLGQGETFQRMKNAILNGTFNKDSDTFKRTCKELRIKHTYKAIKSFLEGAYDHR